MPTSSSPEIHLKEGVTIISLGPDYENLDEGRLDELRDCIMQAATEASPPLVVIDLTHTRFFGSSFIEVLFRAFNHVDEKEGGKFCLSGLTPYCQEVIEVTHLDRLWPIYPTADEAVRQMSST